MPNIFIKSNQADQLDKNSLLWLDAEAYGRRVALQGHDFSWTDCAEFVNQYRMVHTLLSPSVAPINLGSFLAAWLDENTGALVEMRGKKRIRFALKKLLSLEQLREQIRAIVSALCETLAEPIVLVMPQNAELINWANNKANNVGPAEISDIDIDSVSVYLADFLRVFNGLNVSAVVIDLPAPVVSTDQLDLYSPIVNVAKHYHWKLGAKVSSDAIIDTDISGLDFFLGNTPDNGTLCLDAQFWHEGVLSELPCNIYYAQVPEHLAPELVLERLSNLKKTAT